MDFLHAELKLTSLLFICMLLCLSERHFATSNSTANSVSEFRTLNVTITS
jgi:hypothetical protein